MECDGTLCNAMQCNATHCDGMICNAIEWNASLCNAMRLDANLVWMDCGSAADEWGLSVVEVRSKRGANAD